MNRKNLKKFGKKKKKKKKIWCSLAYGDPSWSWSWGRAQNVSPGVRAEEQHLTRELHTLKYIVLLKPCHKDV